MRRNRVYIWMGIVSLLLVTLIAIQFVWLNDASQAAKKERRLRVARVLEAADNALVTYNRCFEAYAKAYINPQEGFYMIQQKWDTSGFTGRPDTLQMYYDTEGFAPDSLVYTDRSVQYKYPVRLEMRMRFTLMMQDTSEYNYEKNAFHNIKKGAKFRDYVANVMPLDSLYDMQWVDSLLRAGLRKENITDSFGFGFIQPADKSIAYAHNITDSARLLISPYNRQLFSDTKFMKPYKLALVFPTAQKPINTWLLLSIGIIIICTISFYVFVKQFIDQARLSEMKTDFINNLTHEFNTPMANIALAVETLEEQGNVSPKVNRLLSIIGAESARLRGNIERTLQVATLEKGNFALHKEQIDLVLVITTIETTYQLQCEQLNGHLHYHHPDKLLVYADETHIVNSICNILDNAIKYRKDKPEIEIDLEDKGNTALLTISDNGQGMSSETQKHIFEKFYRAHQGDVHNTKGFGLGLNYVKGIIETHGGIITVWSKPGTGTKFIIQLPK